VCLNFFFQKKKRKMAASRQGRHQSFTASSLLFNDDDDVDMRDAMASGRIQDGGIFFNDTNPTPPVKKTLPVSETLALSLDNDEQTGKFINLFFSEMKDEANQLVRPSFSVLTSHRNAEETLKWILYNLFEEGSFRRFSDTTWDAKIQKVDKSNIFVDIDAIMKRVFEETLPADKLVELRRTAGTSIWLAFKTAMDEKASQTNMNMKNLIALKMILDRISIAESRRRAKIEDSFASAFDQEPPYLPSLSYDEKRFVWSWVQAKEAAFNKIYSDDTYQFTLIVAGCLNLGENGIEKLVSFNRTERPAISALKEMPPSINDNTFISKQRDILVNTVLYAQRELQQSIKEDVLLHQQTLNLDTTGEVFFFGKPPLRTPDEQQRVEGEFRQKWGTVNTAVMPKRDAYVATEENSPASEKTAQLRSYLDMLERMKMGITNEDFRSRMLIAAEWMQKPEVLGYGHLKPIFKSGLAMALLLIRQRCCSLSSVTEYDMLIKSPDSDVVTAFAKLVAIQIEQSMFENPTSVRLDKTGARLSLREERLLHLMAKFKFDGTKVLSNLNLSSIGQDTFLFNF
jgi:hypothetical protein